MAAEEESVTFSAFVLSLAASAAMHFGDVPEPGSTSKTEPDLDGARQMIDILQMLGTKTRGNLTADEERLLGQVLYELRLRYVEAQQPKKRIIEP